MGLTPDKSNGLWGYIFPAHDDFEEPPKYDMRDKSFGDLWVEFLLRESGALDKPTNPQ